MDENETNIPLNDWNIVEGNVYVLVRVIVRNDGWLQLHNEPLAGIFQIGLKSITIIHSVQNEWQFPESLNF